MSKILGAYRNGNYFVSLYDDGTKIRETPDDFFAPAFAESFDMTITSVCDGSCPYCYAGCTPEGKHADLFGYGFLDTLHPYTEAALNGNDLSHPQLEEFLRFLKSKKVIANLTVNQRHFTQHYEKLRRWSEDGLIHGLGVSYTSPGGPELISLLQSFPNLVVHTIAGILTEADIGYLGGHGLKILILGYKTKGRGAKYQSSHSAEIDARIRALESRVEDLPELFRVVSFDNLGLEQLHMKAHMSKALWDRVYMGDEGQFTFFIDLVSGTFAKSSLETEDLYPITQDNIDDMFRVISETARCEVGA